MVNLIIFTIMGGVVAILINYLSDVLPRTRRFSKPVCPHCEKPYTLKGYLISFNCPNCGHKPSTRNFLVYIISIIATVLVGVFPMVGLSFWPTLPILVFLGTILVIDIEHHVVLIETSIAGLVLMFVYGWFMQGVLLTTIGGIAGFVIMLLVYFLGLLFSRGIGKRQNKEENEPGLGFGDVYACAFLGFFTGWPYVIGMIILGILASGIYSFIYLIVKSIRKDYQLFSTIPYTPFLILGAIATFYIPQLPIGA
jgi:prepilin signal peptidase PulO-like enzyme (type II secretory pathway)